MSDSPFVSFWQFEASDYEGEEDPTENYERRRDYHHQWLLYDAGAQQQLSGHLQREQAHRHAEALAAARAQYERDADADAYWRRFLRQRAQHRQTQSQERLAAQQEIERLREAGRETRSAERRASMREH